MPLQSAAGPPDEYIGPYHLLDALGSGGMGTVYLAEQREPVRRRVALKVIKPGMDSKAVLARFEAERQALSMMEHSSIARVYDAGTTDRGQPYFAMEYVKGIPITDYCDQNRLGIPQRIALFRQVCAAVQHAHLKGVMHRDLKPSNILVTLQDGVPVPKVIDFGLAKAMDHRLVEATIFTEQGVVIGTPEYMSPEQAGLSGLDIDTRTDVYSLGVLLYELLTGAPPFRGDELRRAGLLEMQRIIRETEPAKPSTRVTALGEAAEGLAMCRSLDPSEFSRRLRGDLDWIAMKAIEKDRTRRYETALELAADLERHLEHVPVLAGPPGVGYRVQKFVRRHRVQCAAAAAVFAALVLGGAGTLVQWLRAEGAAKDLTAKVREFDQLAGVVLHEHAMAAEAELYPAWPDQIAAMEAWLRDDCDRLLAMRAGIEQAVRDLRARALPASAEEIERDRRTHPRLAEWQQLDRYVASLRRAQALREGRQLLEVPLLPADVQADHANALNMLAWERVVPEPGLRRIWGEEAFGLACAQAALARSPAGDRTEPEHELLDTLAWALFCNGRDAEARQRSKEALAAAPAAEKVRFQRFAADLEQAVATAPATLAAAEQQLATLAVEVAQRHTFTFADAAPRFLHDTLRDLLGRLEELATNVKPAVEQRLSWARRMAELTRNHPRARVTWAAAADAIARADGVTANGLYGRQPIAHLPPQTGLVPIGMNPVTKLWEFYELRSAWDGKGDPAELAIPEHDAAGSIAVGEDTGIVFVLVPGGTFTMGAQPSDPDAQPEESPHDVTLLPFFMARHELTRAQWERLTGGDRPFWLHVGRNYDDDPIAIGPTHPAESIDWTACDRWLRRHGLELPTEAQWEYAARAGTTTPWWTGPEPETLAGAANVLDQKAGQRQPQWGRAEAFTDGFAAPCPVGTFRANAFGLFDVHGNVFEWCRDRYVLYGVRPQPGDGLRETVDESVGRVARGGCMSTPAVGARSAFRHRKAPEHRAYDLGVRPARIVTR